MQNNSHICQTINFFIRIDLPKFYAIALIVEENHIMEVKMKPIEISRENKTR